LKQERKKQKKEKQKENRTARKQAMTPQEKAIKEEVAKQLNKERVKEWGKFDKDLIINTEREVIFESLLNMARKHLKDEGRIVFLYPIFEDEEFLGVVSLPPHHGFEVIDMSQQELPKNNSRILVTLQKCKNI
jgi:hypothetical protein